MITFHGWNRTITDLPFDVTAFLYHGTDVPPGPHGMPGTVDSLAFEQQFDQQVSTPTTQRISPVEFADLFHNIQVDYLNPRTGLANSVTINVHAVQPVNTCKSAKIL